MKQSPPPLMSAGLAALLIAVALVSFSAVMVLAGWAPELRERNRAGEHPYSTSALGFNGLYRLLDQQDYPVRISRLERELETRSGGLMIITLTSTSNLDILSGKDLQYPTLVVLPKWIGRTDNPDAIRYSDTTFMPARLLNDEARAIWSDAEILRTDPSVPVDSPFGPITVQPDTRLQLIRSGQLETIVGTPVGALVAFDVQSGAYVLSDPDMLNTFGLARPENALFAMRLIDLLRSGPEDPVIMDAATHGFQRSENLLKMLFSVPFLGATLIAAVGALLLGWAGAVRFGPPLPETRAIATGKGALVDNSAGLVVMTGRETAMAPDYAALIRRRLARRMGFSRSIPEHELTDALDRLGPAPGRTERFSELETALRRSSASREQLMRHARALHQWQIEILKRILR